MTMSANFTSKSVFDQQGCRTLTFALARLSCFYNAVRTGEIRIGLTTGALIIDTYSEQPCQWSTTTQIHHTLCFLQKFEMMEHGSELLSGDGRMERAGCHW